MKKASTLLLSLLFLLSGCSLFAPAPQPYNPPTPSEATPQFTADPAIDRPEPRRLTVMTHDSFAVSEELVAQFEQENNVNVTVLKSGDTGEALNKAILSKNAPLADVFYGVDNTFLSRALQAEIFQSHDSPLLEKIDPAFRMDPFNRALPVNYGDVCINYDKAWFAQNKLFIPEDIGMLGSEEYKGLLVVENPATSSPGLAFLLATVAIFGDPGYLDYWQELKDNGLVVVNGWETAYYTNFSASSGKGAQPMVVSYASSPAAEVIFAAEPLTEAPTASILDGCFRQVEFVGILAGSPNRDIAAKWIDFMLSVPFQQDVPLQMFVYPVNRDAALPPEFEQYAQTPVEPLTLSIEEIAQNREKWIEAWSQVVLP
jgi:thiamine transport system substrate-binding protein